MKYLQVGPSLLVIDPQVASSREIAAGCIRHNIRATRDLMAHSAAHLRSSGHRGEFRDLVELFAQRCSV